MVEHNERVKAIAQQVRHFIDTEAIPRENPAIAHDVEALDRVTVELRMIAIDQGIYAPQLPESMGGLGLSWRDLSVVIEAAGRSFLGPVAMNCAAPDQPNMLTLMDCGTPAQCERYLAPLVRGDVRSCFAMTEPPPGAGSDPAMLKTLAERRHGKWVINGKKWFISGAVNAQFALVLAKTAEGATLFIVETNNPGYRVIRNIQSIDGYQIGGHGEIEFVDCEVSDDAVLGEVGQGFTYAQRRLEPARLLHCMRFIGRVSRAMELAQDYVKNRSSFGERLADLQQVQAMVADSHIDLYACRLMTWDVAQKLDLKLPVKRESAMAKVFVSEALYRVADRAAQMMGALGMSEDSPVSLILREMRPFRIYDGASELHRSTLARRILKSNIEP